MSKTPEELQNAFGFLFKDELSLLRKVARLLPNNPVIVNIGAGAGTSTSTFMHERRDATVYSVDIQNESSPYGSFAGEQIALERMGLLDYNRYHPIHDDSKVVGAQWTLGQVDLIFVDGDHSYDGCYGDIVAWWPHLKDGGYMAIHDYERDVWPQVKAATDKAMAELKATQVEYVDTLIVFCK